MDNNNLAKYCNNKLFRANMRIAEYGIKDQMPRNVRTAGYSKLGLHDLKRASRLFAPRKSGRVANTSYTVDSVPFNPLDDFSGTGYFSDKDSVNGGEDENNPRQRFR